MTWYNAGYYLNGVRIDVSVRALSMDDGLAWMRNNIRPHGGIFIFSNEH